MSNNFNPKRIRQLIRWCRVTDKPFNRKTLYQTIAVLAFIMQLSNIIPGSEGFEMACGGTLGLMIGFLLFGGLHFNQSYSDNAEGYRTLHLLPASNAEKFVTRYVLGLLNIFVICTISILIADALQYLVGWIIGRDPLQSVILTIFNLPNKNTTHGISGYLVLTFALWLHTLCLLSCNLWRNIKYNWVFTFLILFIGWVLLLVLTPKGALIALAVEYCIPLCVLFGVLSILNVWLSYKLFCHWTVIGKIINRL